ncbi:MAG: hypothetical protein ABF242_00580 [Flavobacteriales bacterium]
MAEKSYITIEGESFEVVKNTLEEWIDLYTDQLDKTINFEIIEKNKSNYLIKINGELNNMLFHFLVNYFRNPDRDNIKTRGYTTVKDLEQYPESELNKRVVVFVPDEDKEYDNVYASTGSGKLYIIDFGFKRIEIDQLITFNEPDLSEYITSKSKHTLPTLNSKVERQKEEHKEDLTKIFAPAFLVLSILNIYCIENNVILKWPTIILGIILSWWIAEAHNKALLKNRNYLIFLGLSMILFYTGWVYDKTLSNSLDIILAISFFHSFFMLLFYQVLRPIYKLIIKKEPTVDRSVHNFSVFLYTLLIIFLPGLISFIMIESYLDYLPIRPK